MSLTLSFECSGRQIQLTYETVIYESRTFFIFIAYKIVKEIDIVFSYKM
jgi:hypothetical protein